MSQKEQWSEIAGSDGNYLISSQGKVMDVESNAYITVTSNGGVSLPKMPSNTTRTTKHFMVSRIMLSTFDRPAQPGEIAMRKDITRGFELSNLQWGTRQAVASQKLLYRKQKRVQAQPQLKSHSKTFAVQHGRGLESLLDEVSKKAKANGQTASATVVHVTFR